jgi:alpha-amylase
MNENSMRKWHLFLSVLILIGLTLLIGCSNEQKVEPQLKQQTETPILKEKAVAKETGKPPLNLDINVAPMGNSDGVFYEIFVRSFSDSNGDGIGDLKGVTNKLDYLQDLGIKGIWLMPIMPSPSYHGYDVTDYYNVNQQYGTLEDMSKLTDEAHKRGIKVIIDLVVNHSSSEHPWFIDSAKGKDSKYRDWYTWAEDKKMETSEAGAWGQNAWHRKGDSTYLGIFWEGMPDLNLDNPEVRKEFVRIGQFWLNQGVDGFRLDAAKHVYEDFKSSVNNPEVANKNQVWWQEFRKGMDEVNKDAYIIGEVWDTPAVVGPYLDHALNSGFNFDLAKQFISTARAERATTLASTLRKTYEYFSKQSQGAFVDAPFLTNHDQNRVMSELQGNVDHAKMAASLLLTMPGNPYIYYGEEIGMQGKKPDERIREPLLWTADGKADGQTGWELSLYQEGLLSIEEQLDDPNSLLNHYKKMIAWRNQESILGDGGIAPFQIANDGVLGFLRIQDQIKVLIVHNLSGEMQLVDLNANGIVPFEQIALSSKDGTHLADGQLELPPYSSVLLK